MKLSAGSRFEFERCIDGSHDPETSIVCRYRNALRFDDLAECDLAVKRYLPGDSIREGVRVVPLLTHGGVDIHILDETTGMATGSLKSIDGCLTASLCRAKGIRRIAFESGGNTGNALTRYGRNAGLETFFFCPLENVDMLDSRLFDDPRAHLIAVEDRGRVKELAGLFSKAAGIRHVPDKSWRYAGGMLRGLYILERMLACGEFDWISQTVSAAFGPIGIFKVLEAFRGEVRALPGFLGIQQEANCPMFRAWRREGAERPVVPGRERGRLLARTMYDESPDSHGTWRDLRRILLLTRGDLLTVNGEEFDSYIGPSAENGPILELLRSRGIAIGVRSGEVLEKAGMIALAGTLKAIDAGVIPAGGKVLCAMTGGASSSDGRARPETTLGDARDVLDYVETVRGGGDDAGM